MSGFDSRTLRDGFGEFMTGVTVVTTREADGEPTGLTVNSFSSLSLDPPLVLFAVDRDSNTFDAFELAVGFVVHVLAEDQEHLAVRFATRDVERFEGLDWSPGLDDLPVISGSLASFECRSEHVYDGGDHRIHVGRVERLTVGSRTRRALGYFRSRYIGQG
ncbi:MAG TPA: flavin reductase family protein [Acidimicrobiia bacterium]|nr:flavin reductase family protein [Acidimicrobiia bacterium]